MKENKEKQWFLSVLITTVAGLCTIFFLMLYFDPYFHFHGPLPGLSYRLTEERYINSGIAKNFEYNAIITGSSMNQNFKTSSFDQLFGTKSVKTPFSGGGFEEVSNHIRRALESKNQVKMVLWGLDYNGLNRDFDWEGYDNYPEYLYDKNPLNDLSYIYNKNILLEGLFNNLVHTITGQETTSFDEYSSWEGGRGWDSISNTYTRSIGILPMEEITQKEIERVTANIERNIVALAKDYPDTQFILFYTPYSALYWESIYRDGWLEKQLKMEEIATSLMLSCENIKLYNFNHMTEITNNIQYYRDKEHYVWEINEMILQWIVKENGLVTRNNYKSNIEWTENYYRNFNYDILYEGYEQYMLPQEDIN